MITFYYFWIASIPNIGFANIDRKEKGNTNKIIFYLIWTKYFKTLEVLSCVHVLGVSVSIPFINPLSNLFLLNVSVFSVNAIQTFYFVPWLNNPVTYITLVLSLVLYTVQTVTVTLNTEITHIWTRQDLDSCLGSFCH